MTPPSSNGASQGGLPGRVAEWIAKKLSRVTSSVEFIPEVDGLRFLAIMPVLAWHSTYYMLLQRGVSFPPGWEHSHGLIVHVMSVGPIGVQIFFVISGFIVSLPFARHFLRRARTPKLSRYYLRRLTRIEPPYFLALTAIYLFRGSYRYFLRDFLAGLVYGHQIIFGTWNPINIANWSLEVEVCFYLLAPLLTCVYLIPASRVRLVGSMPRRLLQLALIFLSSYFVHGWLIPWGPKRLLYTLATEIPFFLAGILLADLYATRRIQRSARIAWDFAGVACAAGIVYAASWDWELYWLTPVMIMVIFVSAFSGRAANWCFRQRPVTIVGGMCYTIYLWHNLLVSTTSKYVVKFIPKSFSDGPAALLFCFVMIPVLIVASMPLFYLIEKPFMNGPGSRLIERGLRGIFGAPQQREGRG